MLHDVAKKDDKECLTPSANAGLDGSGRSMYITAHPALPAVIRSQLRRDRRFGSGFDRDSKPAEIEGGEPALRRAR